MFQANVYKIMVGAPSDIHEEIQIACRVINKWNNINSESKRLLLLPLHWSFSSYPSSGSHPQKIINKQLVEKSDLMLCFFGGKLGTETDTDLSGTVEEINGHLSAGKTVMVFFRQQVDLSNIDIEQLRKLNNFKHMIQDKVLWFEYNNEQDLEPILLDKLSLFVNANWQGYEPIQLIIPKTDKNTINLSEWDKEHLKAWVNSGEIEAWWLEYSGWGRHYFLGKERYYVNTQETILEWDDFFERMQDIGFITLDRYSSQGTAVYKLKKAARDYVKNNCNN